MALLDIIVKDFELPNSLTQTALSLVSIYYPIIATRAHRVLFVLVIAFSAAVVVCLLA
jgi:hypothetical protein